MTALKLLGCLLVLSSGAAGALGAVRYERARLAVLEGWIDLIFYIRTQIDCYLTPLGEILAGADRELLRACGGSRETVGLDALLRASRGCLCGEAARLLTGFVREIGGSYREGQVRRCDYYLTALRAVREQQKEELPARVRVCVAVCLCAALGIAILLW